MIVRNTVPCEQFVNGIEYVVPEPVTVPFIQVDDPVPDTEKSPESIPVTDCEKTRLKVGLVEFVNVSVGAKVEIEGPNEVISTEPAPEFAELVPDWFKPLFFEFAATEFVPPTQPPPPVLASSVAPPPPNPPVPVEPPRL